MQDYIELEIYTIIINTMKKLFGLLALVLAVVSCQNDFDGTNVRGGEVAVTLNVAVPDEATRAAGSDSAKSGLQNIDLVNGYDIRYILEVYDKDGELAKGPIVKCENVDASTSFDLRLVPGRAYRFVVWADFVLQDSDEDLHYYTEGGLQNISLIEGHQNANDESRDAYTCVRLVEDFESGAIEIELKRPFAKLRVVTTDMNHLYSPLKSVTVDYTTPIYTTYNALTEVKGGLQDVATKVVDFTKKVTETEEDYVYVYTEQEYKDAGKMTLFADYLFGTEDGAIHFTLDAEDETKMDIPTVVFNTNIPVQRNYLTTVMGPVLTDAANVTVKIEDAFDGTHNVDVVEASNASDLQEAIDVAAAGKETHIVLGGDINLNDLLNAGTLSTRAENNSYGLLIPAGKSIVLDLNGCTLKGVDTTEKSYGLIRNCGNLTILNGHEKKDGKITLKAEHNNEWNRYSSVISNEPGSVLVVESGIIEHLGGTDMAYAIDILTNGGIGDVKATINGGTIKSTYRAIRQFLNSDIKMNELVVNGGVIESTSGNKSIWMQDPSAKSNKGKLTVTGGTLNNDVYLTVTAGSTAWPVEVSIAANALAEGSKVTTNNVPDGYFLVLNDGVYSIVNYRLFEDFVNAVVEGNGTFDGQGETFVLMPMSGDARQAANVRVPSRLQKYSNPEVYYAQYQRFAELGDINISNVNIKFVPATITVQDPWNTAGATTTDENINGELQFMNSGSVTLTDCTFEMVAVSPFKASSLAVTECEFNDLKAYAIKDLVATNVNISDNEFNNCNGGFWFSNAPASVTAKENTFSVGRRGAIQFSANGDYTNSTLDITDNNVEGALLWQLNNTLTLAQYNSIVENNTYTTACVDGSIIPAEASVGGTLYETLGAAVAAAEEGATITLLKDVTLTEELALPAGIIFNGNGKQINGTIYAEGNLTFVGHTKVTKFSASYYNRTITIGEGACLEVTSTERVTLGYGNTFNITGSIQNAKSANKETIQPSLIIPGGISITGGNDATMNVNDAYISLGNTSSKNNAANGVFTLNFTNSIVDFTNQFTLSEPTGGKKPTFNVNITDSVVTTTAKLCIAATDSNVVVDNSILDLKDNFRNSGTFALINGSVMTGSTIQFGENGGNDGAINVDASSLTITATSTGHAFDGKGVGSITASNGAEVSVDYYKAMTINVDATSKFTGTEVQ